MSKLVIIKNQEGNVIGHVDEHTGITTMRCPNFFRSAVGRRETFTVYRGQIIVRTTVQFSSGSQRRTCVYLYFVDGELKNNTLCVSTGNNLKTIASAKRMIDRVLDNGIYHYGMDKETP